MDRFRVGLEEIPVYGQDEREVVPAGIRLDDRLRRAVLFDNTQYNVSAAPIVDIIGERTQGVENLFGIPPLLVLDSRPFHLAVVDEIVYVYRQRHSRFLDTILR